MCRICCWQENAIFHLMFNKPGRSLLVVPCSFVRQISDTLADRGKTDATWASNRETFPIGHLVICNKTTEYIYFSLLNNLSANIVFRNSLFYIRPELQTFHVTKNTRRLLTCKNHTADAFRDNVPSLKAIHVPFPVVSEKFGITKRSPVAYRRRERGQRRDRRHLQGHTKPFRGDT